jgi:magnesium chelatase subunit I
VALFNIMQEGDVQIKGYPVRLELDIVGAFSANPEDYTARGKIVTPLKDRIGSEIRTHYPETLEEGMAITAQEAWSERGADEDRSSALLARGDRAGGFLGARRQEGGQAQRREPALPISTMELVVSNAERRALIHGEKLVVPRVSDIYTAMPGITGKLELEYEGEMRGADVVVRDIDSRRDRQDLRSVFLRHQHPADRAMVQPGGTVRIDDDQPSQAILEELKQIQGLFAQLTPLSVKVSDAPEIAVAAAEFLLEGMYAHKRLSRSEERGFTRAGEGQRVDAQAGARRSRRGSRRRGRYESRASRSSGEPVAAY